GSVVPSSERSRTAPRRAGASRHHDGCAAPTLRNRPRPGRTFWTSQAQTLGEGPTEIPDSPRGLGANRSALALAQARAAALAVTWAATRGGGQAPGVLDAEHAARCSLATSPMRSAAPPRRRPPPPPP